MLVRNSIERLAWGSRRSAARASRVVKATTQKGASCSAADGFCVLGANGFQVCDTLTPGSVETGPSRLAADCQFPVWILQNF